VRWSELIGVGVVKNLLSFTLANKHYAVLKVRRIAADAKKSRSNTWYAHLPYYIVFALPRYSVFPRFAGGPADGPTTENTPKVRSCSRFPPAAAAAESAASRSAAETKTRICSLLGVPGTRRSWSRIALLEEEDEEEAEEEEEELDEEEEEGEEAGRVVIGATASWSGTCAIDAG
jgi:hypothetical protein